MGLVRCVFGLGLALGIAVGPAAATPPLSEKPLSEKMADCAGVLRTVAGWVTDAPTAEAMLALSDRWLEASVAQARDEGAYYPEFYAVSMQEDTISEWEQRRVLASVVSEFERWGEECRALAEMRGLPIYDGVS